MSNSLPQFVNPWLLFRHHEAINGRAELSQMPNLCASQNRQQGEVLASVAVEKRLDGQIVVKGRASAELSLTCQRCLQPIEKVFEATFELVLVKYEHQLERVGEKDDALVVEEQLDLLPLIEQELILTLPMIAKHDNCQVSYENIENGEEKSQQPFANLKDLLN